ncbi:HAAS signaling domain-containing protein [Microbacterium rhizomatis]|uniref:Uncharacterized protein n=1 Tax=Microbacterium rhizomatis TaxID=1631477 RepID=A0A5J5J404_9MICO|nr:hypothetical protein [Microbacterium rhizomatis]KAA9110732.1 hypothetical protein F6B43_03575 [Microbacterium rhizomatis]
MATVEKYTQQLMLALRLRDVPGEVIGDAIAQVESHIAETGEDPVAAFGPAREYAASFGGETAPARRWPWYIVNWLVGFLFGCVLIIGVFGQMRGEEVFWGFHPIIAIVVGAVGLVGYFVIIVVIWGERVKDPRKAPNGLDSA